MQPHDPNHDQAFAHPDDLYRSLPRVMDRVVARLVRTRRHSPVANPEEAVSSAVRELVRLRGQLTFDNPQQLYAWLYLVAERKLRDRFRREHIDRRRDLEFDPAAHEDELVHETERTYEAFVERLEPELRIVLTGRMDEKSFEEIAAENGWTVNRVAVLVRKLQRKAERLREPQS